MDNIMKTKKGLQQVTSISSCWKIPFLVIYHLDNF